MGNKQSKKQRTKSQPPFSKEHLTNLSTVNNQYTYAEVVQLIQQQLLHYLPIDLSGLILSFIPRSTIGDESNPINPYDVMNVHVHLVSPYTKIPARILSIFNLISPNCHCGAVLSYTQYQEIGDVANDTQLSCARCAELIDTNKMVPSCYNPYFHCPAGATKHDTEYNICSKCTYQNIEIYQENDGDLFDNSLARNSFATLQTQRRVCLAFTEDYVRVYLHCFKSPVDEAMYCNTTQHWRHKRNMYSLDDIKVAILLDDFSVNWEKRGKNWTDYMEQWSGGSSDSIYIALCHCNQINHKIANMEREKIENYLSHKQTQKHNNVHDKKRRRREPWSNLCTKLFDCSITEDEDTITAILDIVGGFLSNLNDEQKRKLTYRGKFGRTQP